MSFHTSQTKTCFVVNLVFVALNIAVQCDGASLSPKDWPKEDFERLKSYMAQRYHSPKPLAVSQSHGIVSGTTNSLAVHAGIVALQQGGNAMDACVATALTEVALAAGSYVSFAGVTEILYYKNSENRVYSLDGGWNIPADLNADEIPPLHTTKPNGASVLVPGFFAGISAAVERLANFELKELLEPALYFAENGFKLPDLLGGLIAAYYNDITLLRTEDGKNLFTNPETGTFYKSGEIFKQLELLKILQMIANDGVSEFYTGEWAQDMISLIKKENGVMTMADMSAYTVNWKEAINTTYHDYLTSTSGTDKASSGGVEILEKLNLMELANIGSDSYLTNSTKLYWLASIIRFSNFVSGYLRTVPNAGDILQREFHLGFSLSNRTSKDFAASIWSQMSKPGGMDEINNKIKQLLGGGLPATSAASHSDGVVAMDKEGNVCSLVHTINSEPWGTGLFVHGIALPHSAAINKYYIKQLKAGSRLNSELQPLIVFRIKNESKEKSVSLKPAMAISVVGASLREVTPQLITSVLDENMNPVQALSRSQFMLPSRNSYYQDIQVQRCTIDKNVLLDAISKGQMITEIDDKTARRSYGLGVLIHEGENGVRCGASTPALDGIAESEYNVTS